MIIYNFKIDRIINLERVFTRDQTLRLYQNTKILLKNKTEKYWNDYTKIRNKEEQLIKNNRHIPKTILILWEHTVIDLKYFGCSHNHPKNNHKRQTSTGVGVIWLHVVRSRIASSRLLSCSIPNSKELSNTRGYSRTDYITPHADGLVFRKNWSQIMSQFPLPETVDTIADSISSFRIRR